MNQIGLDQMQEKIDEYISTPCKVLDVGSRNVHKPKEGIGCYRDLLTDEYDYTGLDLEAGRNVDVVIEEPYTYPFPDNTFDAVLCGNTVEHVKNPFKLVNECARVLKPGGVFLGIAPFKWTEHKHPVDCWRILRDGWESMFEEAGLTCVETHYAPGSYKKPATFVSCWGVATK